MNIFYIKYMVETKLLILLFATKTETFYSDNSILGLLQPQASA